MGKKQVAIFEDNKSLREGFEGYISMSENYCVNGSFPDAGKLMKHIREFAPEVVLMDINMPGMDGIEAVGILHREMPELPVIMLTVFEDADKIFAAICAGACGYLLKSTPPQKIIEALDDALQGGSPMSPSVARKVLTIVQNENALARPELIMLTVREKQVLTCLVKGMSYKMIAEDLAISFETVRTHMKKIYEKLHVNSLQEAVSKAIHSKIV